VWISSLGVATRDVIGPFVSSGIWLPAAVWAVAAAVLPSLVRGVRPALDIVRVAVWSAALVSTTTTVLAAAPGPLHDAGLRGAAAGALVGAIVALGPSIAALLRSGIRVPGLGPGLP
jgi:hypothetical protein